MIGTLWCLRKLGGGEVTKPKSVSWDVNPGHLASQPLTSLCPVTTVLHIVFCMVTVLSVSLFPHCGHIKGLQDQGLDEACSKYLSLFFFSFPLLLLMELPVKSSTNIIVFLIILGWLSWDLQLLVHVYFFLFSFYFGFLFSCVKSLVFKLESQGTCNSFLKECRFWELGYGK